MIVDQDVVDVYAIYSNESIPKNAEKQQSTENQNVTKYQNVSYRQCRINNSSKCSTCYGSRAFWGPAVFCNKSQLLHYQ